LKSVSHIRSLVKGITWRTIGTIDTTVLAFLITGNFVNAIKIGLSEIVTKVILYYFHERLWSSIKWNITKGKPSHVRSLVKGISWRSVGTIDTIILSYWVGGNLNAAFTIGGVELVTKIVLYYLHERLWSKIKWGNSKDSSPESLPEGKTVAVH
jgi:uncharacterized membrane protein